MTVFERLHMPSLGGATEWLNTEPLGPPSCAAEWLMLVRRGRRTARDVTTRERWSLSPHGESADP